MLIVGNNVYRLASPLDQIPTWEKVWESAKNYDATYYREEAYMQGRDEDDPEDVALAAELVKDDVWELYRGIVSMLRDEMDGADCWREMTLEGEPDLVTLDPLGIYWSYDKEAAEAHGGGYGERVTYRARVDLKNVDVPYTVNVHLDLDSGPQEKEVGFHEGARIWVYDVELDDGTVLPINDWRTT